MRELTRACVHCGLCVPSCPTYAVLKEEADSPRGRVLLLDALHEGRVTAEAVRPHLDRCIGCRMCESVCPSGVPFGELLEEGRARLGAPWRVRIFLRLLERRWLVRLATAAARLVGRVPPRGPRLRWPEPPAAPKGTLFLHRGCVLPALYPRLVPEMAHVLTRLGYHVQQASDQGCCGALHRHAGVARSPHLGAGERIVTAAAGCSTTPGLTDVCALLLEEEIAGARLRGLKVAYDAPCHLLHGQGIDAAPLLDRIAGIERVALAGSERCCGAGGLYMETQPALARAVREAKLDAIAASGADLVATPNPGCMLWLWRGLRERGLRVEVVHPVSLLARAWGV